MAERFVVGDHVTWISQANAGICRKTGTVEEVVPAGSRPDRERFRKLYRGAGVGFPRDHESYVVVVGTKQYWPRTWHLHRVEPD